MRREPADNEQSLKDRPSFRSFERISAVETDSCYRGGTGNVLSELENMS
jgi:hypothetical protein